MTIVILVDLLIVAVLLIADLVSKYYAAARLSDGSTYEAIKDVLSFRYQQNTGAAFGMLSDSRVFLSVFVGIVLAGLIGFMVYHIVKRKFKEKGGIFLHVTLSMIVAGGLGNLIDRIAFGYVRDFIDYTIVYTLFDKQFAICNLADAYLTVGVILLSGYLIWTLFQEGKKSKKKAVEEKTADAGKQEMPSQEPAEAASSIEQPEPQVQEEKDD